MSKSLVKRSNTIAKTSKLAKNGDLVIADVSGSMDHHAANGQTKWDCLKTALRPQEGRVQIMAFASRTYKCSTVDDIPQPHAFTALHLALQEAQLLEPMHILVVSDGEPDSQDKALDEARKLAVDTIIDVLYIGRKDIERTVEFMKQLAEIGGGRFVEYDLTQPGPLLLTQKMAQLLALPAPTKIEL